MGASRIPVFLATAASALFWWPFIIEPGINLPRWLVLVLVILIASSATALLNGRWLLILALLSAGSLVSLIAGFLIFPRLDPLEGEFEPITVACALAASILASLVGGLVGRKIRASNRPLRRVLWFTLTSCLAFTPIALALTPPLVARRIARNEQLAAQRVTALQRDVAQIVAETRNPASSCDGEAIKRHYSGPAFSERDWRYIGGNYVEEDGYAIGIWCHDPKGFAVHAIPVWWGDTGVRQFCSDQTGALGCKLDVDAFHVRCTPCPR